MGKAFIQKEIFSITASNPSSMKCLDLGLLLKTVSSTLSKKQIVKLRDRPASF